MGRFLTCKRWAVNWLDPYYVPRLLQSRTQFEADQREDELTGTESMASNRFEANSERESAHGSDVEPAKPDFPAEIPLHILENTYTDFIVPLGVYVRFDRLFTPDKLELLDLYQPAVYGYIRYAPITVGNRYEGFEIDVSRTGKRGRWVLGARISDHTLDERLIGRPPNRDRIIHLRDPRLRLSEQYRLITNPDFIPTRQAFITRYLQDVQQHSYIRVRERRRHRREVDLMAQKYRHTMRRRHRRLAQRRQTRIQDRQRHRDLQREKAEPITVTPEPQPNSSMRPMRWRSPVVLVRHEQVRVKHGPHRTPEWRTESSLSSDSYDDNLAHAESVPSEV